MRFRAAVGRVRIGVARRSLPVARERITVSAERCAVLTVRIGEVPPPAGAGHTAAPGMSAASGACYELSGVLPASFR